MDDIEVSICCITYNQINFIETAIASFLAQKTSFKYEILIHDDCSTDGTIEVLKKYEMQYPEIVKILYEDENQFSKGVRGILGNLVFPKARGKYIAICEGDDFWCEENKLQMQYDLLETHPEYSMCFHDAKMCDINGIIVSDSMMHGKKHYKLNSGVYSCEEILKLDFYPTASIFFRANYFKEVPEYYNNGVCGDLPIRIYLADKGFSYCINQAMSVYRVGNPSSASGTIRQNMEKTCMTLRKHNEILQMFDESTNYRHHEAVCDIMLDKELQICLYSGDLKNLHDKKLIDRYKKISLRRKIKCYVMSVSPSVCYLIEDLLCMIRKVKGQSW